MRALSQRAQRAIARWLEQNRRLLPLIFSETAPLELTIVGRMLFHAALVGVAAGVIGVLFFGGLEYVQRFALEDLAGYIPLRAHGETFTQRLNHEPTPLRPFLLILLPAIGGVISGLITRFAPEARGGGGDAMIEAFHHHGGVIRKRVIWVKGLASIATLGLGGSGGREGPTMMIGGAIGSAIARVLKTTARERRILLVAGVAAGIAAVFRTPLGAALLAVEVLYRDSFESDALIPSVLASVVAYSVVISVFGESTLLAHAPRYPFVPVHLPLYAILALCVAGLALAFASSIKTVGELATNLGKSLDIPAWLHPGIGGLLVGILATTVFTTVSARLGIPGHGLGILGGGYGAAQTAITGAPWMPDGWTGVELLLMLTGVKLLASALTIGSGGSAGDFAPSLVLGGLFGGAFGRAASLLFNDPRIDPGAFALVGMGAFYGGIAHVPLAALVLVCELAGSYDLLVPLMLAEGIAFVALRKRTLYASQVATQRDSPVHRDALLVDLLKGMRVRELMAQGRTFSRFRPKTAVSEMVGAVRSATWQDIYPVIDDSGALIGMLTADALRLLAGEKDPAKTAADFMQPPVTVLDSDDLRHATELLIANGLREILVVDDQGNISGFLDEAEIAKVYLKAAERVESTHTIPPIPPVPPV